MKNPLTLAIETRLGIIIVASWAAIFIVAIIRAQADYTELVTNLYVTAPPIKGVQRVEKGRINRWILDNNLTAYGDPEGTAYPEDTPRLVDEMTGESIDRYAYLAQKFPEKPWRNKSK